MALLAEMTVKIGADISRLEAGLTRAKAGVKDFGSKTENIRSSMDKVGKTALVAGTGLGLGLGMAVKSAAEFDKRMAKVSALSGATGKDLGALRQQAISLGASTVFSANEAADAMAALGASGMSTKQIMVAMPGVLSAAAASGEDLAATADTVVTALSGFGLGAGKAQHVADVLAQAANKSTASIGDMGETLKYVGPLAKATGVSLETVAGMATIMANAGIKGSQAGTTLRMSLARLATVPPPKIAGKLGNISPALEKIWKSADPVPKKLAEMSVEFGKLSGRNKTAAASYIFGTEAMSGMMSVMDAGPAGIAKMTRAMQNSDGVSAKMAKTMNGGLSGAVEQLGGTMQSLGIAIGEPLAGPIRTATNALGAMLGKFMQLSPQTQKFIAIGAAVAAAGLVLGGGLLVVTAALIPLIGAVTALDVALGPIILIVLAVVAVIAGLGIAFVMLYRHSQTVRDGVHSAFEGIRTSVSQVLQSLRATISVWVGWAKAFWARWGADITRVALTVWHGVAQYIKGALQVIKGVVMTVMAVLRGDWRGAWEGIKTILSGVWNMIVGELRVKGALLKAAVSLVWKGIKDGVPAAWNGIKGLVVAGAKALPGAVKSALSSLVGMLADVGSQAGSALGNAIRSAANAVLDRIRGFTLPTIKVAGKTIPGSGGHPFSGLGSFAGGGWIHGPGTGTSDSIVARLSNGEAVIPAAAARKHAELVNALIDGTLPGFAAGRKAKPRPKPKPAKPKNVGTAAGDVAGAAFAADQSDAAAAQKRTAAQAALNAAVKAQQEAENKLPGERAKLPGLQWDAAQAAKALKAAQDHNRAIIGKNSAQRKLDYKPTLDRAVEADKKAKAKIKAENDLIAALSKQAKESADKRDQLASQVVQYDQQLNPPPEKPATPIEQLRSDLDSLESVAGLSLAQSEATADTGDDGPAKAAMQAFQLSKAAKLSDFLSANLGTLKQDEATSIRSDIASSIRAAASYNTSDGAGTGGADPATAGQGATAAGGGGGDAPFMSTGSGGSSGGGGSVQVNTSGGGANGVGYVPDGDLHPVFLGAAQINDLGWDGATVHGVKVMVVNGWDEAEDAQVAVDNRSGQDGEIARELLLGGSTLVMKGIVSGASLQQLYANRRVLKGKLQAQAAEQVLKMPDRALAQAFATAYGTSMAGYLRKSCRVVQNVTWGDAVGPFAHWWEVTLRAADPRRLDDVQQSVVTGAITSGGGFSAPMAAPLSVGATGVGGTATVVNGGDYPAPFTIQLDANGSPIVNPIIEDLGGAWSIVTDGLTITSTDYLVIDMLNRTVMLNGTASRFQYVDFANTKWGLLPEGASTIRVRGASISDPSTATITFRPAYL